MGKNSKRSRSPDSSDSSDSEIEKEKLEDRLRRMEKILKSLGKNKDGDSEGVRRKRRPRSRDRVSLGPETSGRVISSHSTIESVDGDTDENENDEIRSQEAQEELPDTDPLLLEEVDVPPLNPEILQILGEDKTVKSDVGEIIHKDIAVRWDSILKEGLDEPIRASVMKKYPPVKNCSAMGAPKLNKEVKAALTESARNRDDRLLKAQNQVGASLSAIGKALTILVGEDVSVGTDRFSLIELLSDAGRLLADAHHSNSETRRGLAMVKLNKELKETFTEVGLDGWLFGENLNERVKMAKAIERSGREIRESTQKPVREQKRPSSENFKRPLKYPRSGRLSGQKPSQIQFTRPSQYHQQGFRQEKRGERNTERRQGRRYIKK